MRMYMLGAAAVLLALATGAGAWVGEDDMPPAMAKLRSQYRAEYEKGMAPIVAKCRQTLQTQLNSATIRRNGADINLFKDLLGMLAAGQSLDNDSVRTVSSKVPREAQIACDGFEGDKNRLVTGLKRRYLGELARLNASLKAAGNTAGVNAVTQESHDIDSGDLSAWGETTPLARSITKGEWQWMGSRFSFRQDGLLEGECQWMGQRFALRQAGGSADAMEGRWKQTGSHSVRIKLTGGEGRVRREHGPGMTSGVRPLDAPSAEPARDPSTPAAPVATPTPEGDAPAREGTAAAREGTAPVGDAGPGHRPTVIEAPREFDLTFLDAGREFEAVPTTGEKMTTHGHRPMRGER